MSGAGGMILVLQPPGSSLCGQACTAMITGLPLEEVISRGFGGHRKATSPERVREALQTLGWALGERCSGHPPMGFGVFLCSVRWPQGRSRGHWILLEGRRWLDPLGSVLEWYPGSQVVSHYPLHRIGGG